MKTLDYLYMALKRLKTRIFESIVIIMAIGLGSGVMAMALSLSFAITYQSQGIADEEFNRSIHIQSGEQYSFQEEVVWLGEDLVKPATITLELLYDVKNIISLPIHTTLQRGTSLILKEMDESFTGPPPTNPEEHREWEIKREESHLQVRLSTEDEFYVRDMPLLMGDYFTRQDVLLKNQVIVLGHEAYERLFPDENPLGKEILLANHTPFTVIGVLEKQTSLYGERDFRQKELNRGGVIPISTNPWEIHPNPLEMDIHGFTVVVKEREHLTQVERELRLYLQDRLGRGFAINSPLSWQREMEPAITRGQIIAALSASLGLIIAAINILNLMLARVLKRTKEIGVLSALGCTRRTIFWLFLYEALMLGFFGALLGFGLALLGEQIISSQLEGFFPKVDLRVFLASIGIAGTVSLLFGIYPALEAARIHPIEALRTD